MNNKTNALVAACLADALPCRYLIEREATFDGFHNPQVSAANGGRKYPYKADVAVRELKLMIEYNGPYHYKTGDSVSTLNDVNKRRWCRKNDHIQICINPSVNHNPIIMEAYLRFRLYTQLPGYQMPEAIGGSENDGEMKERGMAGAPSAYNKYKFVYDTNLNRGVIVDDAVDESDDPFGSPEEDPIIIYLREQVIEGTRKFFKGNGKKFTCTVNVVGRDHVTFVIRYSLLNALLIDTRFATAYSPNMRHNLIYVTFWKRFPRVDPMNDTFLFFRYDAIHVPLFLFGKRGDPLYHLTSYLACRIFDHSDEATFHWKMANDPHNTKSLYYTSKINNKKTASVDSVSASKTTATTAATAATATSTVAGPTRQRRRKKLKIGQ